MKTTEYLAIKQQVIAAGYGREIQWCEDVKACDDPKKFLLEYIWVVLNSGMKNQVAQRLYEKVLQAMIDKKPIRSVFKHPGKVVAINAMIRHYRGKFNLYRDSKDKLFFLETLPWIGKITKFHLGRNLGLDVCKPDRHLSRIAAKYNTTALNLCETLSVATGDRIGVVDVVLWRAANLGFI